MRMTLANDKIYIYPENPQDKAFLDYVLGLKDLGICNAKYVTSIVMEDKHLEISKREPFQESSR